MDLVDGFLMPILLHHLTGNRRRKHPRMSFTNAVFGELILFFTVNTATSNARRNKRRTSLSCRSLMLEYHTPLCPSMYLIAVVKADTPQVDTNFPRVQRVGSLLTEGNSSRMICKVFLYAGNDISDTLCWGD